jgi:four helix bundle protein
MTDATNGNRDFYPLPAVEHSFVAESKSNPVREKSFKFALMTVSVCRKLQADHEYVISKQLMRSGTSVGANIEEAVSAESRRDFLHKMNIALKEAREAHFWLRLLDASEIDPGTELTEHVALGDELIRLLVSITRKVSRNE